MKLLNIGGATGILEHKGKRILFDPWMDDGIYHGSWYHYPPAKVKIDQIGHLDYLYISHIHEDHCSAGTIKHLNRDLEVIVMDMPPNFVVQFLKSNGFNFKKIHKIKPQTPTEIAPGLIADMVTADPAHDLNYRIDSGLILKWDNFVIYNANDCPPYDAGLEYIKKQYHHVDLALLPYAGGSGYPATYVNLNPEQMRKENKRIFANALKMFTDAVQKLSPTYAMPFADQYVIAGSRAHLNKFLSHPPGGGVTLQALRDINMEQKSLLLNSGQSFDLETQKKDPDEPFKDHSESDRETYIETHLKDKVYDHEMLTLSKSISVDRLVSYARARMWEMQRQQNYFPRFSYYLDIPEFKRRFHIALDEEFAHEVAWDVALLEPRLRISASQTLMIFMLIGHISWNIADAALFLDYERIPNVYDPKIHAFINFLKV